MQIPKEVKLVIDELQNKGFEAFIVGGCVRDLLLVRRSLGEGGRKAEPEDWDVATNAKPEEIKKIFPKSFYENKFLTVTVQTGSKDSKLKEIETTTYRSEAKYTDKRHPDLIRFAKTIEQDLARRDFTINAMALGLKSQIPNPKSQTNSKFKSNSPASPLRIRRNSKQLTVNSQQLAIIDPFGGKKDLKDRIIRAVGKPEERFSEDALRMMRAVRLATTLGFKIEEKTAEAIAKNSFWLQAISKERIRDEFLKIIMAEKAAEGIEVLRELNLLKHIVPELEEGYKITQNKHHAYDCYEHCRLSLKYASEKGFNKFVRLASLFHDIGKPRAKRGEGPDATFYNHEILGAKMTIQILTRLKFPKKDIEKIAKLVRHHLFYYNVGEVSESSVRRLVRQAGPENMEELLQVRMSDRIGSGVAKAEPYKLRHLKYIIEKVSRDPVSVKTLKVSGNDVMRILSVQPSPKVGQILDVLLGYVLFEPEKNNEEFLEKEIKELGELSDKELKAISQKAKKEREQLETKKDEMTKKKYWVT